MLQSRVLVLALILLLGTTFPEVHSKSIFERDNRRDWMVLPDSFFAAVYETVNKMSPRAGQFLENVAQTPAIVGTRNYLIKETTKINAMLEQLIEKLKNLWNTKILGY
ncbi:APOV1 protein, partial [Nothoprocta ornata]|uniref:Apovitellenin-1 n=3 Tax=Nothoprocta TaxID=8806 RepID=A0A8C6YQL2_NOTPE|nr:apovitellenin-1-like [Nothoprocta perdicaria]NWX82850.1 APOV1 protein [Nothoprocta pentlandii]NWY01926.1 APOV1 protein [Nothoprocta ornata]